MIQGVNKDYQSLPFAAAFGLPRSLKVADEILDYLICFISKLAKAAVEKTSQAGNKGLITLNFCLKIDISSCQTGDIQTSGNLGGRCYTYAVRHSTKPFPQTVPTSRRDTFVWQPSLVLNSVG